MAPREAVALMRARALPVPVLPRPRLPARRTLATAGVVLAALGLLYPIARFSPLFAVRQVAVEAASPARAAEVRTVLGEHAGRSLVGLDARTVEERLRDLPTVRSASVDRAFPHTLAVRVEAEQPLAVVRDGARAWVVAESGRVVQPIEPGARPRLPRLRIPMAPSLEAGATLADPAASVALGVLRAAPPGLARTVRYARVESGSVELVLRDGLEMRLGDASAVDAKLAAAAAVLRALSPEERATAVYIDASVPERVAVGENT